MKEIPMFKRRIFLIILIAMFTCISAYAATRCNKWVGSTEVYGKLCSDHGFGSKADNCAVCGKWVGSAKIYAKLCNDHAFGIKKDDCVVCGKWVGSSKVPAKLCSGCGFGSKADNCARME